MEQPFLNLIGEVRTKRAWAFYFLLYTTVCACLRGAITDKPRLKK